MSAHLARGGQEDSPDWLRYSSGKGAGFLWQNSSKSFAKLSGRMTMLACWYPIVHMQTYTQCKWQKLGKKMAKCSNCY